MTLIQHKNNLYPATSIFKIEIRDGEYMSILLFFESGLMLKFSFEDKKALSNAVNKLEEALLKDKDVKIDQDWLGANKSTSNV